MNSVWGVYIRPTSNNLLSTEESVSKILVPCDLVIKSRSRKHIQVAVVIQIGRIDSQGTIGFCRNDLLITEHASAKILIPSDLVVLLRSREHIHVPITIQICSMDRSSFFSLHRDDLLRTETASA